MTLTEDRLADLLRGIADGVEPPAHGPERVLAAAAAPRRSRARQTAGRTRGLALIAVTAAVVLVLGLVAFVNGGTSSRPVALGGLSSTPTTAAASSGPELGAGPSAGPGAQGLAGTVAGPATTAGPGGPVVPTAAAKVVKTGSLTLQVLAGRVTSSVDALATTAAGLGGYVASTATTDAGGPPTADVTLRVPSAQFEALLARAQALGTTMSVATSGQDVTGQFVDLNARITALEASRQRYLDILTHASTVGDILAVQQQLDGLQSQLEELRGQLNVLTDQTSYGTLTVHLQEPGSSPHHTAPSGLSAAWQRARRGFTRGAEAVIGASGGVAVFLGCVAVLALVARVGWGLARRRLV
jgi:hypothetical protein